MEIEGMEMDRTPFYPISRGGLHVLARVFGENDRRQGQGWPVRGRSEEIRAEGWLRWQRRGEVWHSVRGGESRAFVGSGDGAGGRRRRAGPGRPAAVYRARPISLPAFAGSRGGFVIVSLRLSADRRYASCFSFSFLLARVSKIPFLFSYDRVCLLFLIVRPKTFFTRPVVVFLYLFRAPTMCQCVFRRQGNHDGFEYGDRGYREISRRQKGKYKTQTHIYYYFVYFTRKS